MTSTGSHPSVAPSSVQWPPQDAMIPRRPGPFEPEHPTSRNTIAQNLGSSTLPVSLPVRTGPSAVTLNQSPWFASSQVVAGEDWGSEPNSLTTANLGQHNMQQELKDQENMEPMESLDSPAQPIEGLVASPESTPQPEVVPEASKEVATSEIPTPAPSKSRRKAGASYSARSGAKAIPAADVIAARPPSPVAAPVEPKSPWSIDDEKKSSGAPLSLREIQELEIKKLEARKASERERSVRMTAASTSASPSSEDIQTLSWGLPTSQAGTRSVKEPQALPTPAVTATLPVATSNAVWTNAIRAPVVKKTMKEIQEEEEKRKKLAKDKETVAAISRRAYADTTNKVCCSSIFTSIF